MNPPTPAWEWVPATNSFIRHQRDAVLWMTATGEWTGHSTTNAGKLALAYAIAQLSQRNTNARPESRRRIVSC